ncbi:hypothetical protein ACIF6L_21585 [Kitasatospora sp. NPDC086009]
MSNFAGTKAGSDMRRSPARLVVTAAAPAAGSRGASGDDDGFGWQVAPRS